jgi:hypothetical protein
MNGFYSSSVGLVLEAISATVPATNSVSGLHWWWREMTGKHWKRIDGFSGAMVGFWREGQIRSENGHYGVFIQNWVGRTRENGQHDNGRFIRS